MLGTKPGARRRVAMARLKAALIPMLMGQSAGPMRGIFEQVFR
jgi:hypothetical protein